MSTSGQASLAGFDTKGLPSSSGERWSTLTTFAMRSIANPGGRGLEEKLLPAIMLRQRGQSQSSESAGSLPVLLTKQVTG